MNKHKRSISSPTWRQAVKEVGRELQKEIERHEIMNDMSDETDERTIGQRPRFGGNSGLGPRMSFILGFALALLLMALAVFIFSGGMGGDKEAAVDLDAVKSRLDELEKNHLVRIEAIEQKISFSGNQIMELQTSLISLEKAGMKDQAEKSAQHAPPPPQVQSTDPQIKPDSVEKRFHVVRGGETLFSIAKKYGMNSEELRRLNHLLNDSIKSGQRLVVVVPHP